MSAIIDYSDNPQIHPDFRIITKMVDKFNPKIFLIRCGLKIKI